MEEIYIKLNLLYAGEIPLCATGTWFYGSSVFGGPNICPAAWAEQALHLNQSLPGPGMTKIKPQTKTQLYFSIISCLKRRLFPQVQFYQLNTF